MKSDCCKKGPGLLLILVLGLCLFQPDVLLAAGYTVVDLGTLGGDSSKACGINNSGQVIGHSKTAEGQTHAFLWDGTEMRDLGTLGDSYSVARAINDAGQIVGCVKNGGYEYRAFIWDGTTMKELGNRVEGMKEAWGISSAGHVAGLSYEHYPYLLLWNGEEIQNLTPETSRVYARAMNASGQIAGFFGKTKHAFLWNQGQGGLIDLGTLGGKSSEAYGINNDGHVVGNSKNESRKYRAFLWDGATMNDLGVLEGGDRSYAYGINNSDQVVGKARTNDRAYHAFLFDGAEMKDLNSEIEQDTGWVLEEAWAINDNGWIVGNGELNGEERAFLLKVRGPGWAGISGQVTGEIMGEQKPLKGARISVCGQDHVGYTNEKGAFLIEVENAAPATWDVMIEANYFAGRQVKGVAVVPGENSKISANGVRLNMIESNDPDQNGEATAGDVISILKTLSGK